MSASRVETMAPQVWGYQPEQLAVLPTVYRDDLFRGMAFVVSGGGSGMGRATLFLLARLGAEVLIVGRNEAKLLRAADDVQRLLGVAVQHQAMTIRDPDAVAALAEAAFAGLGRVDGLINNAGGQFPQEALDLSAKGWNAVVDTNLNGTFWMMQAFAHRWRERGQSGSIVNITMVTDRGVPQSAHSCAARAGVIGLSKSVAVEWAPIAVRVNCIAPGTIETEGLNNYPDALKDRMGKGNPMKRMGDTWDIAQAVAYLSAPSAKFITGETLHVDGGMQLFGTNWPLGKPEYFAEL